MAQASFTDLDGLVYISLAKVPRIELFRTLHFARLEIYRGLEQIRGATMIVQGRYSPSGQWRSGAISLSGQESPQLFLWWLNQRYIFEMDTLIRIDVLDDFGSTCYLSRC